MDVKSNSPVWFDGGSTHDGTSPPGRLAVDLQANIVVDGPHVSRVPPRVAELLYLLVEAHPAPVPVETVIAGIWGVERPRSVATALRNSLSEARRVLVALDWEIVRLHSWARPALMLKRASMALLVSASPQALALVQSTWPSAHLI